MNLTAKYAGRVVEVKKEIRGIKIGDRITIEKIIIDYHITKTINIRLEDDEDKSRIIDYNDYNTPEKALKDYFKIVY